MQPCIVQNGIVFFAANRFRRSKSSKNDQNEKKQKNNKGKVVALRKPIILADESQVIILTKGPIRDGDLKIIFFTFVRAPLYADDLPRLLIPYKNRGWQSRLINEEDQSLPTLVRLIPGRPMDTLRQVIKKLHPRSQLILGSKDVVFEYVPKP